MPRQRVRVRHVVRAVHRRGHHVSGRCGRCTDAHHRHTGGTDIDGVYIGHGAAAVGNRDEGQGASAVNLTDLFDLSFIGRRDSVALEFEGSTYTFGEVDARSNRMAQMLRRRGLKQGDRLCVQLANCVEMIDLYLACVKLGVIFVPINILYRDREVAHIVNDAAPKVVVSDVEGLTAAAATMPNERPGAALDG